MIRVLIADDHPIVVSGLKHILQAEPDISGVGDAQTPAEIMDLARRQPWDVVVLDLSMPGRGGLEVLKDLKYEHPKLPVLILSVHPEDQFAERVLRAGASGYLTKESVPDELVKAIRKAVGGHKYISPMLAERLATRLANEAERSLHEGLSDREYLVMTMMARGRKVREIADELSLSVKTVATYRTRIFKQLCVKRVAELIRYAIEKKLVE